MENSSGRWRKCDMRDLDETLNLGSLLYFRISSIMEEIPKMILDGYFDLYFIASNIF
jgi:hypothetical protein